VTITPNREPRNATRVAREGAANPRIMIYHASRELTDLVIAPGPALVLAAPGVDGATVVRYRLRVRRSPEATWEAILPALDAVVLGALGAPALVACPPADQDYRSFALARLPDGARDPLVKRVYEGARAADADPEAAPLFALDGVAEAIFERGAATVTVRKGRLHAWEEGLAAAVERALARGPS